MYTATVFQDGYEIITHPFKASHRNEYVARVQWMSGDADVYTYSNYTIAPDDIIRALNALSFANGKRFKADWGERLTTGDNIDADWFFAGAFTEQEWNKYKAKNPDEIYGPGSYATYIDYLKDLEYEWEYDQSCEDCGYARFDSWRLTWYDDSGMPHPVEVKKDGQTVVGITYWRES